MHKLAATKNNFGRGSINVFVSQFSASFLIKIVILLKHFFNSYLQSYSKDDVFTPISLNVIADTPNFWFKRTTAPSFRDWICWRRKFFLYCISSIRIGFSAIEPISKALKLERQRDCLPLVRRMLPSSSQDLPIEIQGPENRTHDTRLCSCLVCLNLRVLHLSFHVFIAGSDWFEIRPKR